MTMHTSRTFIAASVLLLGVAAVEGGNPGILPSHRNVLTFSGPGALPGVSLDAGTYVFELADPSASSDAVVVMNRDRRHIFYLGMTRRVDRPVNLANAVVTFGEAPRGKTPPIRAWYPAGDSRGYQFIYPWLRRGCGEPGRRRLAGLLGAHDADRNVALLIPVALQHKRRPIERIFPGRRVEQLQLGGAQGCWRRQMIGDH